jgi:hypothetical protein
MKDAMTLRAFLLIDGIPVEHPAYKEAAKQAHEDHVASATPKNPPCCRGTNCPKT